VKTYAIKFDEDLIRQELEETAEAQHVNPEEFVVGLVASTLAPQSDTAQKFYPDRLY
jgi:hypothetical protein